MMGARRLTMGFVASVCVLVGALACASVPALAAGQSAFAPLGSGIGAGFITPALSATPALGEFGGEGEGPGQFVEAQGIAVSQETGDVYLADTNNNRVEQFGAEGQFLRAWGSSGTAGGQLSRPEGVAIDNSAGLTHGDVYVQDTANNRVDRFSETGQFILTFGGGVNKTAQETAKRRTKTSVR